MVAEEQAQLAASTMTQHNQTPDLTRPCCDFCCSPFFSLAEDVPSTLESFSKPIHPIFREGNFHNEMHYETLKPSLRLASQLLQCDGLVPYINTIFDGEIRNASGQAVELKDAQDTSSQYSDFSIYPRPGQEQINPQTRERANEILKNMSTMVRFQLQDQKADVFGQTIPLTGAPLPPVVAGYFPNGWRSYIEFGRDTYKNLVRWHEEYASRMRIAKGRSLTPVEETLQKRAATELLSARFSIAGTIVHEIGHVIRLCAHGYRKTDIFYKDNVVAEAGFELTAQILPGDIQSFPKHDLTKFACGKAEKECTPLPSFIYICRPWPDYETLQTYRQSNWQIGAKPSEELTTQKYTTYTRIPMAFIHTLFTDKFWDEHARKRSGNVIPPDLQKFGKWPFKMVDGKRTPFKYAEFEAMYGSEKAVEQCRIPNLESTKHIS
jgi:hypothetical protein